MTFKALQNGSDIRGIAISTTDTPANLTVEAVEVIASGLVAWLKTKLKKDQLLVGVGRDSRISGPILANTLIQALLRLGVDVINFNLATTPALFMSTQFEQFACDCGVMFTASHLPFHYNGIKIFTGTGGAEHEDIAQILAQTDLLPPVSEPGQLREADLITPYANFLVEKIKSGIGTSQAQPLQGFKIIVDAGNGAGGFFAEKVLQVLGADTSGSQFLEPDGHFPNHIPNPDNKEAMAAIQQAVMTHKADLGVIFDTDVDRAALVTSQGELLNRNNLIAVLAKIVLEAHPGTRIVTNSPTSSHLKAYIEALGGIQVRYISGYRNVINKMLELNAQGQDCQLAIETSGHAAFLENFALDDGAYVIAKVLMILPQLRQQGQSLDSLMANLKQPAQTQEVRFKLETPHYRQLGLTAIEALSQAQIEGWQVDSDNEEGIRMNLDHRYGDGWLLLRLSLHEPLLVLQIETDQAGFIPKILLEIQQVLNQFEAIDQSKLIALLA